MTCGKCHAGTHLPPPTSATEEKRIPGSVFDDDEPEPSVWPDRRSRN